LAAGAFENSRDRKLIMKKTILMILAATILAGCAAAPDPTKQGVLDFGRPPNPFATARLVNIDGRNIVGNASQFTHWVDPGEHVIVLAAALDASVGTVNRSANRGQGETTIVVEAGKRYRLAAQATDNTGGWEPVVWQIQDL
jgi:hypothetical protein